MNRRAELIKQTFRKGTIRGTVKDWLFNCLGPTCSVLAKARIEEVEEEGKFVKVKLRQVPGYLYYPRNLSIVALYQTLAEQLYPWQWHYYQIPQTRVTPEDIVLDCGCAEGSFSFLIRDTARHIYAIEPLPKFQEALQRTFGSDKNITIVPKALGDQPQTAYLESAGMSSSITHEPTDVSVTIDTLDNICQENQITPTYLKADLEGYEMSMLTGAKHIIKEYRPKIAITTYHQEQHAQEIKNFLKSLAPSYQIKLKGIEHYKGAPVMLHAWT